MVRSLITVFAFVLCALMASAGEEAMTLMTNKGDIKGTLLLPDTIGNKEVPVVLIIAGSGPTDRNGNLPGMTSNAYKMLAEALAAEGIASVRYDKRGIGESKAGGALERDLRFEDYVRDAKDWVRMLAGDKRFSRIVIAGHSEGSLIGMMAARDNDAVDGYISIAGAGRPADIILKEQLAGQPKELTDMVNPMIDTLKHGDTLKGVPQMLYTLFRPSVQPYMISWFKYDPAAEIGKLKLPVYIVQGAMDIQVSLKDAVLLSAAQPKAEKLIVANMNHVLKDATTTDKQMQMSAYNDPKLPLNKELTSGITEFVKRLNK